MIYQIEKNFFTCDKSIKMLENKRAPRKAYDKMIREYDGIEPIPIEKIKLQLSTLYPQPKACEISGTTAFTV